MTIGTPEDVLDMVEIQRQSYGGTVPWNASALVQDMQNNRQAFYIMVRDAETPVGFIGTWFSGTEAHVTNVAVSPLYQRLGIASFLMDETKRIAIKEEKKAFSLEVRVSNEKAIRLYQKLGFSPGKIKKNYYKPDREDALEMKMNLVEASEDCDTTIHPTEQPSEN